jgi:hypothetical protein
MPRLIAWPASSRAAASPLANPRGQGLGHKMSNNAQSHSMPRACRTDLAYPVDASGEASQRNVPMEGSL